MPQGVIITEGGQKIFIKNIIWLGGGVGNQWRGEKSRNRNLKGQSGWRPSRKQVKTGGGKVKNAIQVKAKLLVSFHMQEVRFKKEVVDKQKEWQKITIKCQLLDANKSKHHDIIILTWSTMVTKTLRRGSGGGGRGG